MLGGVKRTDVLPGAAAALVACLLASLACSLPAALGAQGDSCSQPSDCESNLTCVPQADGTRICSSDLGPIQHTEEGGVDARAPRGDGGAAGEGGASVDGGGPQGDSGSPPVDSGSLPQDSGSPPQDSGSPAVDSGSPADAAAD